jgi:hypothetical protein
VTGIRPERERLMAALAIAVSLLFGLALRLFRWDAIPPGPWIDEALALRAARSLAADPGSPLFGTMPLLPPEAGFQNAFVPNLYLRIAARVDAAAGGGMASVRALSIGPSLLLLAGVALLAFEALRGRPAAAAAGVFLAATSTWLLTTARWGWNALFSSALLVLAAWAALVALRKGALFWSLVSGALVGLSVYGYQAARLSLALPLFIFLALLLRPPREGKGPLRLAAGAAAASLLVAGPLLVDGLRHPDRAFARERELLVLARPPEAAFHAFAENVRDYGALFLVGGDTNERHGDPGRPVLPAPVLGFLLAGTGVALARRGPERLFLLVAATLLAGGLLARETSGANAYRISPAAPFLIVLAACGLGALLEAVPPRHRRSAGLVALGLVLLSGLGEAEAFFSWGTSPRTWGAFGGPERELADAIAGAQATAGPLPVLLGAGAARNHYVVDVLLGRPGDGGRRRTLFVGARGERALDDLAGPLLYADDGTLLGTGRAGGRARLLRRGADPWGSPTFALYRVDPAPGP